MNFKEMYAPYAIGVNGTLSIDATQLGAFIARTEGTINIVDASGTTVLNTQPVAVGQYLPLPMLLKSRGNSQLSVITLAGGASGTVLA